MPTADGMAKASFTVEVLPDETAVQVEDVKKGDVNHDGSIDIMDGICLNKYLLEVQTLTPSQSAAADADGNGEEVDPTDSLLILKYAVEIIDSL
ncbi:MAG: dockerin type I repeat-containing protein [Oscillospiraceae bacterium]|nr:dockerin type I repeat-containing protein [Oscillospiraceae bacterium]